MERRERAGMSGAVLTAAGADLVVPDFTQAGELLALLGVAA